MIKDTIGADISKDHIDLYRLPDGTRLHVKNDRKGFAAILKWIGMGPIERIVYEPTGAYHKAFERFMIEKRVALSTVCPSLCRGNRKTGQDRPDRCSHALPLWCRAATAPHAVQHTKSQ